MSFADTITAWGAPTAVLDFETTGLSAAGGDRVVEVAIIRSQGLNDPNPRVYQMVINPGIAMPVRAQAIHGISDDMLKEAPSFADIVPTIRPLLDGALFIAHNARFDLEFLTRECSRAGIDTPAHGTVIDSLRMARSLFGFPHCSLQALAKRMAIPLVNHHRALADATATMGIYRTMLQAVDPDRRLSVSELLRRVRSMSKDGAERTAIRRLLYAAVTDGHRLVIDYTQVGGQGDLMTTREITVKSMQPPVIDAWCHLRDQKRTFRLDRIQRAEVVSDHL